MMLVISARLARMPNAAAAALRPSVAGPALPVSAKAAITKGPRVSMSMRDQTSEAATGLERSCGGANWVRAGTSRPGFERAEANFSTMRFAPHRHDAYAIGITLSGVQSFGYRGTTAHSEAGCTFVIHPDEKHDGRAGTDEGYRYRIVYIEPRLISNA